MVLGKKADVNVVIPWNEAAVPQGSDARAGYAEVRKTIALAYVYEVPQDAKFALLNVPERLLVIYFHASTLRLESCTV